MFWKALVGSATGLALAVAFGLAGAGRAQQPPTPATQTAPVPDPVTAKAGEPIVAPIQRVKPAAPKLDPRLSAAPVVSNAKAKQATVPKTVPATTKPRAGKAVPVVAAKAPPAKTTAKTTRGKAAAPKAKATAGASVAAKKPVAAAGDKPTATAATR
jgi:hypothetical protein